MKLTKYNISEINNIPQDPGIYKFYDKNDTLVYVGKAKNLKKRVKSYFAKKKDPSIKTQKMVKQISYLEITIVNSEYEALLLENNLIKNHSPKYNILMRDDKTYPFICILNERFPRLIPTRKVDKKKGIFFGPFQNVTTIRNIFSLIKENYKIRTCNFNLSKKNIEKKKFKVCLEYHIKNCKGPCEGLQDVYSYNEDIDQIKEILKGNFQEVKKKLKAKMLEASESLEFELANEYKNKLDSIENYYSKSLIANPKDNSDIDIFAIYTDKNNTLNKSGKSFISYIKVQKGLMNFTKTIEIENKLDETEEEILRHAIIYIREESKSKAKEVYTNIDMDEGFLGLKIINPKIGDKRKIVEIALKNAYNAKRDSILKKTNTVSKSESLLIRIKEDLNLKKIPNHIECFDNSNIQGTTPVAAMVCFKDSKPSKKDYRHFNIKTVVGANDFASMEEVVGRRYKGLILENKPLPDLIIIDGGKGQLNSAILALKNIGIFEKVEIISIAKKLEEIFKPNDSFPLHLNKASSSLKFIQRIRNEAHRFAIKFHKQKRIKGNIKSKLEEIKGIGPKTIISLIKHFGSVQKIKFASFEEIKKVVGESKAEILNKYL